MRFSRQQLLGSFLLLAVILAWLMVRYFRVFWWTR